MKLALHMTRTTAKPVGRFLVPVICLSLALPHSAFALRDANIREKKPGVLAGLEEALRNPNDPFKATVSVVTNEVARAMGLTPPPAEPARGGLHRAFLGGLSAVCRRHTLQVVGWLQTPFPPTASFAQPPAPPRRVVLPTSPPPPPACPPTV